MYQPHFSARRAVIAGLVSATLAFGSAAPALAVTSGEVESARQQYYSLSREAEQANYDYDDAANALAQTNAKIDDLNGQIADTQVQLDAARETLAQVVEDDYTSGTTSLLSIVLGANDFDDLVTRVHYAEKVSESKTEAVNNVKTLSADLHQQQSDLENQQAAQKQEVEDAAQKQASAQAAASSAQSYYNGLSAELQAEIAAQEAAEREAQQKAAAEAAAAAQKAAEEEAAKKAASNNDSASSSTPSSTGSGSSASNSGTSNSGSSANTGSNNSASSGSSSSNGGSSSSSNGGSSSNSGSSSSSNSGSASNSGSNPGSSSNSDSGSYNGGSSSNSGSGSSAYTPTGVIARAYAAIGSGYQWSGYYWSGSPSGSAFTCSGLVDFAFGYSTNSHSPEGFAAITGMSKSADELVAGDLVYYSWGGRYPGHVGIYIGNGQIIDSEPGSGVAVRDLYFPGTFIGGGSL